jgi:lysophospholipase L1-like esterase
MEKSNSKITRLLLFTSVVINVILIVFLGIKYLSSGNTIKPNKSNAQHHYTDSVTYFIGRDEVLAKLPNDSNEVIMLGNSLTHNFEWHEIFTDVNIKNRGINGDVTLGVLQRLAEITESKPSKIFIEIGINDIQQGYSVDEILKNYTNILQNINNQSPSTKIYVQNILPTDVNLFGSNKNIKDVINEVNNKLEVLCKEKNITFIDLYTVFNDHGKLSAKYDCGDHLHLSGAGYLTWCENIKEFVYN